MAHHSPGANPTGIAVPTAGATRPAVAPALVEAATEMAVEAGQLTLDWFGSGDLRVDAKSDGSPVTQADRAAETLLRARIAERFPDDAIIGEEFDDVVGTSGRTWILDPIDGTKSFMRGVPLYATLVAVIDEHGPAVGVANIPALGEVVAAGRGLGCTHNSIPTKVSSTTSLAEAAVTCSSVKYLGDDATSMLAAKCPVLRTWGDGYGYVLLATGRVDAMLDAGVSIWDIAPMLVIVPEAGGTMTTWDGQAQPQGGHTLASNGEIHQPLMELLA